MGQACPTCALESQKRRAFSLACCHSALSAETEPNPNGVGTSKTDGRIACFAPKGVSARLRLDRQKKKLQKALPTARRCTSAVCRQGGGRTTQRTFWTPARLFFALRRGHGRDTHKTRQPQPEMQLRDHAPAALRGVATAASWFVIIACLWVADRNRRPNAFAVLVWLAALAPSRRRWWVASLVLRFPEARAVPPLHGGIGRFSGFWLFVALLTPAKQRDLGKDGVALAAIAVVAAVVAAAAALAATRLEEHGRLITDGCCPARPTLPPCPSCPAAPCPALVPRRPRVVGVAPDRRGDAAGEGRRRRAAAALPDSRCRVAYRSRRPRGGRAAAAAAHGVAPLIHNGLAFFFLRDYRSARASTRH